MFMTRSSAVHTPALSLAEASMLPALEQPVISGRSQPAPWGKQLVTAASFQRHAQDADKKKGRACARPADHLAKI